MELNRNTEDVGAAQTNPWLAGPGGARVSLFPVAVRGESIRVESKPRKDGAANGDPCGTNASRSSRSGDWREPNESTALSDRTRR